jgi:hypothetical protein
MDRTLGLGYVKSSAALLSLVIVVLIVWHYSTGKIAVDDVITRKNEIFYWVTILISNTLGTALGDFTATTTGLGFEWGALVFAGLILLYQSPRQCPLLVGLRVDAAFGRNARGYAYQVAPRGRIRSWADRFFAHHSSSDGYSDCLDPAATKSRGALRGSLVRTSQPKQDGPAYFQSRL